MLRILMLVTGFPSAGDMGTGIFNLRAARGLGGCAHVTVVHLRSWRPFRKLRRVDTVDGLTVYTLAVPLLPVFPKFWLELYKVLAWPLIKRVVRECDVVHSVGLSFAALVGAHWARLASVHHVTQITSEIELNSARLRPNTSDLQYIHGVACNSEALATAFRRLYPRGRNARGIYRGVDLQRFHPGRTRQNDRADGVRFLFLGGFPDYRDLPYGTNTKGGETLLAAWQAAEPALAGSARIVIAGPRADDKSVQRWRAGLRYPDRVELAGMLDPASIAEYMLACDAVLVPSMQEGFPNVAVEAAACGRAVLASSLDGIAELVADGETGILLPPGDVPAWESALVRFSERRNELSSIGARARKRAEQFFDARDYPGNMMNLFHTALREPLHEREALRWTALL